MFKALKDPGEMVNQKLKGHLLNRSWKKIGWTGIIGTIVVFRIHCLLRLIRRSYLQAWTSIRLIRVKCLCLDRFFRYYFCFAHRCRIYEFCFIMSCMHIWADILFIIFLDYRLLWSFPALPSLIFRITLYVVLHFFMITLVGLFYLRFI